MRSIRPDTCCLCFTKHEDKLNLGEFLSLDKLKAHHFCLLLANTIAQSGEDHEGILGFLKSDILREVKRSRKRICSYCGLSGASIICFKKYCRVIFHLPCGLAKNSGHQFLGNYPSFCFAHRKRQKIPDDHCNKLCPICYEDVDDKNWIKVLWATCCRKQYFHKICLQKMAQSAGYFFRCPVCNNKDVFQKSMKKYGVFIPDRDASWELEPNAFEELLYRHDECNVTLCKCPKGRKYDVSGKYKIILCDSCGSKGTHIICSNLRNNTFWQCTDCQINVEASDSQTQTSSGLMNVSEPGCSFWSASINSSPLKSSESVSNGDNEIINISSDDESLIVDDLPMPSKKKPIKLMPAVETKTTFGFVISNIRSLKSDSNICIQKQDRWKVEHKENLKKD